MKEKFIYGHVCVKKFLSHTNTLEMIFLSVQKKKKKKNSRKKKKKRKEKEKGKQEGKYEV